MRTRLLGAAVGVGIAGGLAVLTQLALLGPFAMTLRPGSPIVDSGHGFLGSLALGASVVAPFAAGLAGALHATRGRTGGAGAVFLMATTTYLLGVLFVVMQAATAPTTPSTPPEAIPEKVVVYALYGLVVAAPFYPVCLASAWLWTVTVRRLSQKRLFALGRSPRART